MTGVGNGERVCEWRLMGLVDRYRPCRSRAYIEARVTRSYLRDDEVRQGGELRFVMGAKPNKLWGKGAKARPFSPSTAPSTMPRR